MNIIQKRKRITIIEGKQKSIYNKLIRLATITNYLKKRGKMTYRTNYIIWRTMTQLERSMRELQRKEREIRYRPAKFDPGVKHKYGGCVKEIVTCTPGSEMELWTREGLLKDNRSMASKLIGGFWSKLLSLIQATKECH